MLPLFFSKLNSFSRICPKLIQNSTFNSFLPTCNVRFQSHLNTIETSSNVIDVQKEKAITKDILRNVNENNECNPSRLFAVVQICGKQFKVTTDDLVVVEGYWPPDVGDKITLNKVLCAGGLNFSLIGTPLVQPGLVNICATVVEKTLSHTKTHFRMKRRKQYRRIHFYRSQRTVVRINDIGIGKLEDITNN